MLVWLVLYSALCRAGGQSQRIVARWACGHLHRMYTTTPVRGMKCAMLCWFTELEVTLLTPLVGLYVHGGCDYAWTLV